MLFLCVGWLFFEVRAIIFIFTQWLQIRDFASLLVFGICIVLSFWESFFQLRKKNSVLPAKGSNCFAGPRMTFTQAAELELEKDKSTTSEELFLYELILRKHTSHKRVCRS